MRKVALAIAAVLVLSVVAPAFSQPFADVPTDHWAFDAIAELAAKGIVEGYPDGTFKGDRAMTRYEMAMVVARLLARVEAIKIPPPAPPAKIPAPPVSAADIATLRRLVNEFRAELAALGVRVTAVEEELAALRARLDNTKITGSSFIRITSTLPAAPAVSASNLITFTGAVASNVTAVLRLSVGPTLAAAAPTFDRAYVDVRNIYGINWRVGRQLIAIGSSDLRILYASNTNFALRGDFSAAGLALTGLVAQTDATGTNVWFGRAGFSFAGFSAGVNAVSVRRGFAAASNGFSFDITGSLTPGVTVFGEFASWTATGAASVSAWRAGTTLNLAQLGGLPLSPSLTLGFWSAPAGFTAAPAPGALTADTRGWDAALTAQLSPKLSGDLTYTRSTVISTSVATVTWDAGVDWSVASKTTLRFDYQRSQEGVAAPTFRYRATLSYSW